MPVFVFIKNFKGERNEFKYAAIILQQAHAGYFGI
jgi:hypothetical protein